MRDKVCKFLEILTDTDIAILESFLAEERVLLRRLAESTGESFEETILDPESRDRLLARHRRRKFFNTLEGQAIIRKAFAKKLGVDDE